MIIGIVIGILVMLMVVVAFCAGVRFGTQSAKEQMEKYLGSTIKEVREKLQNG